MAKFKRVNPNYKVNWDEEAPTDPIDSTIKYLEDLQDDQQALRIINQDIVKLTIIKTIYLNRMKRREANGCPTIQ